MTRTMDDSITLANIPLNCAVAATYANGTWAVAASIVANRFPRTKYGWCRIDVRGDLATADARDWETGDKGGSLEQWVTDHNEAAGRKNAVVYCNRDTIPEVRQLTGTQVLGTDYWLWVATLDGTVVGPGPVHLDSAPFTYPGVVACQVRGVAGGYDMSVVFGDSFFLPVPGPAVVLESVSMTGRYSNGTSRTVAL